MLVTTETEIDFETLVLLKMFREKLEKTSDCLWPVVKPHPAYGWRTCTTVCPFIETVRLCCLVWIGIDIFMSGVKLGGVCQPS